jgi:hypothetical protein
MSTDKRNDEIDLIEVFQKFTSWMNQITVKFFNFLYSIFLFFVRRSILISIVLAIGLIIGFYQFKTSQRFYSSSLEAYSNAMSSIDMINYINNIHELFYADNNEGLEQQLDIDEDVLGMIKDVKAFKVIDVNNDDIADFIDFDESYETSDTTISKNRFVIKVEVYDQTVFPIIQKSILNYIGKNQYINNLKVIREKQLNQLIAKLNEEIISLESLKNAEYFEKKEKLEPQAGQLLVMNERQTQLYHEQIISLYIQKQELEKTLQLRTEAITVIQEFSSLSKVENDLISYIKSYGILFFILGTFVSFLIENIKGIKNIISDSKR